MHPSTYCKYAFYGVERGNGKPGHEPSALCWLHTVLLQKLDTAGTCHAIVLYTIWFLLTWHNLEVRTNAFVNLRGDDFDAGEACTDPMDTLRSCNQAKEQDLALINTL